MRLKILLIDDEEKFRKLLGRILALEGYEIAEAPNGKIGLQLLKNEHIDAVICDVKLPDRNGVDLLKDLRQLQPNAPIILLTAFGNIPDAVQAVKNGGYHYLVKGDNNAQIIPMLAQALSQNPNSTKDKPAIKELTFAPIRSHSKPMKEAIKLADKVGPTSTTVLITGETGTGKEVFAQYIHQKSRANQPFVAINCGALGKDILESELFGYKAGAFTGAHKDKKGLLAAAHQGSLFLDEIGEMPLELQPKLLRVLETQTFIPVGDTKPQTVDVRLIAATHRNLKQEAEKGNFRLDLYYRLSVFELHLPPLRARKEDIPDLAAQITEQLAHKMNIKPPVLSTAFIQKLAENSWQGNIRELKNSLERALILSENGILEPGLLPDFYPDSRIDNRTDSLQDGLELAEVERKHILKILAYTQHNKAETARILNIGLTTLYRKLEEYKIPK